MTFAKKDFAAVYMMTKAEKDQIKDVAAAKVKALGLTPTRKSHGIKFQADDLYLFGEDSDGNKTKRPIEHTTSISDILRFINNAECIDKCDVSKHACDVVCKLYVLTQ